MDRHPVRAWIAAMRPKTLPVGAAPVLLGAGFAWDDGVFRLLPALAALAGALLIQMGTNLANDYYDHRRGADTERRVGPARASASGALRPTQILGAGIACFVAAAAVGVYLILVAGWPILVVGLLSLASGYAYTGGPYPLGYHGFGDLFVFVFFGPVAVAGTYFVQSPLWPVPAEVLLAGAALGACATAVLVVNNLRDLETDRAADKRTLAVKLGRRGAQVEYLLLLALAYAVPAILYLQDPAHFAPFLPFLSLPLALHTSHVVWHFREPRELLPILGRTGALTFLYALLFSAAAIL